MIVNARFLTQSLTGVQRYAIEISKYLKKLYPDIVFVAPHNILHVEIAKELDVKIIGFGIGYFWEQIELPLFLMTQGSPLLFCPANMAPIIYKNKITTIHDIAFIKFSMAFHWKFRLVYKMLIPLILKTSRHIVTISQFSKSELLNYYDIPPSKISVIYLGISKNFKLSNLEKENYLLGVASLDSRKNFQGLIKAFLKLEHQSLKLYIIGERNNVFKSLNIIEHPNIKFIGRVSDKKLVNYYSKAIAFIYPSFYEGFGLPPLEAMACGTAVIASNTSSLPEVCADAAIYCNPYNIDDIKEKIELVLNDDNLRIELIDRGLEHTKKFSWEESAKKHLEVFEKVLNS
ncbi:MAG: glycosyltransferase family 1 protein [Erysipelotrichia bacterium]|nr:glycosyltransferase family 1 protein [Erysipelotrichia bacterium]